MTLFRRSRQETTLPPEGDTVIMRFLTLGGATVVVVERVSPRYSERFDWVCLGCCQTIGPSAERDGPVRNSANKHAGECRALPMSEAR